jgi:hypothetical protein
LWIVVQAGVARRIAWVVLAMGYALGWLQGDDWWCVRSGARACG